MFNVILKSKLAHSSDHNFGRVIDLSTFQSYQNHVPGNFIKPSNWIKNQLCFESFEQYGWVQPDFKGVVPQNPTSMSKVKKRGVFVAKDTSSTKRTANNEDMYVNRYRASKASELVVQKKKVTEVKEWLEQSFKGHNEVNYFIK